MPCVERQHISTPPCVTILIYLFQPQNSLPLDHIHIQIRSSVKWNAHTIVLHTYHMKPSLDLFSKMLFYSAWSMYYSNFWGQSMKMMWLQFASTWQIKYLTTLWVPSHRFLNRQLHLMFQLRLSYNHLFNRFLSYYKIYDPTHHGF